jgi:hypothetical protein
MAEMKMNLGATAGWRLFSCLAMAILRVSMPGMTQKQACAVLIPTMFE